MRWAVEKLRWPLQALRKTPWPPSLAKAESIDLTSPIQEERTPSYKPELFYPARFGEILQGRYQIATKLGYGTGSTVWLARDLHQWRWADESYVAVKIHITHRAGHGAVAQNEIDMLRHITTCNPQHRGCIFVRRLQDIFTLRTPHGEHQCLVFEPLRESLSTYIERWEDQVITRDMVKLMLMMMLNALDYLHTDCHIIHTDLKLDNVMVKLEDNSLPHKVALEEYESPLPQKYYPDEDRFVYLPRRNFGHPRESIGVLRLVDFDLARRGDVPQTGAIQADIYRAPEVIAGLEFSYSADIWNLGVLLWDLLEGKPLFGALESFREPGYDDQTHLDYMAALLGPAPEGLLEKGTRIADLRQLDTHIGRPPPTDLEKFTFENTITRLEGEEKRLFIDFAKKMIAWRPEERTTAKELLKHPWLYTDHPDMKDV